MSGYMTNGRDASGTIRATERTHSRPWTETRVTQASCSAGTASEPSMSASGNSLVFGNKVNVLPRIRFWTDKDTGDRDQKISSSDYNGQQSFHFVPVNAVTSQFFGYRIYITPTDTVPQEPYQGNRHRDSRNGRPKTMIRGGQNNAYYDTDDTTQGKRSTAKTAWTS